MEPYNLFLSLFHCFFLLASGYIASGQESAHQHYSYRPKKLFVFGDSYADTGNLRKSLASSWSYPYGITFPGKPTGRFSDGRVLTDYLARFLGLKTPIGYTWMKLANGGKKLRFGMNFAFGGSGVFDTYGILPNMTTQIDFFENLLNQSVYTERDLQSSVVLVSLAGNDYGAYQQRRGGNNEGLINFIPLAINQLEVNLKRLHELGAKKIIVTAMEPLGCLPPATLPFSFHQCNESLNSLVVYHNLLLRDVVSKLNHETGDSSLFILDLYQSFTTVLENKGVSQGAGNMRFESPLKPCCFGVSSGYFCGSVNETGARMYTLCSDPKSSFFWDSVHPTGAGWRAVFMNLKSSLNQFILTTL